MSKSPVSALLPLPKGLTLTAISETPDGLLVCVTSTRRFAACPLCSTLSRHIHSHYSRSPADLPCTGRSIRLLLSVRKFFCGVPTCPRKIFTERLPQLLEPSSRLTTRLRSTLQQLALICGGRSGQRLAATLGMPVSDTTLLSSVQLIPASTPPAQQVRVIGIDDWSWRRGRKYGTIIVDLQTHKVIDLLPDRSVETVRAWLASHPEVEVVSRDRGANYIDAVNHSAPQALQVADRWHLYSNLGDAVEAFLVRAHIRVPYPPGSPQPPDAAPMDALMAAPVAGERVSSPDPDSGSTAPGGRRSDALLPSSPIRPAISARPQAIQRSQARLLRKWKMHEQVHQLHSEGLSLHQIAREMDLSRNTVRKYARRPVPMSTAAPEPTPRPRRASKLDPHEEYLVKRWKQGCSNAALLYAEIREQGYAGGRTIVKDYVSYLRRYPGQAQMAHPRKDRANSVSPRELRWLLARQKEELDEEQTDKLKRLLESSSEVQRVHALVQNFHIMVRHKREEMLDCWLEQAEKSGIREMQSFALGVRRDYAAVKAAVVSCWSQGQTEGQVNKLKTFKRAMYGRAGFALLRQRVLQSGSALPCWIHQKPG